MSVAAKQILTILIISAVLITAISLLVGTGEPNQALPEAAVSSDQSPEDQSIINNSNITNPMNPIANLKTSQGQISLELFADQMPVTVANFVKLAESGFYNDTKFHRVIDGFMIQGGDPNSKESDETIYGQGGPGYNIQDEFVAGELLTNVRGTIAMANTSQPNSGGSQWFINLVDNTNLDFDKEPLTSKHPVFGRVIDGLAVVDQISGVATKDRGIPVEPIVIETIEIIQAGGTPVATDSPTATETTETSQSSE